MLNTRETQTHQKKKIYKVWISQTASGQRRLEKHKAKVTQ
jgi:hypothetical protein